MKIPFGALTIADEARELVNAALEAGRVSSGRYVRELEKRFAELVGVAEAVAVSTGTDADALALAALYDFGAERGDEVIVPALSFVATGNAVLQAGLTPVFVDVRLDTLNIDPDAIEDAVTDRTRAILPVHLMGKPADMDAIAAIADRRRLAVIEDAAEAHGGAYRGRNLGGIGDMGAFSLYVAHIITSVEGGMITTDRPELAEVIRSLRSHGRACKCATCVVNTGTGECKRRFASGTDIRFVFERIGFSAKMNELEAAVGLGSLGRYDEIVARRRANLLAMIERVNEFAPLLSTIAEEPHERLGPHALPILVADDAPFTRDELILHLGAAGIDTRDLFRSMPTQCPGFAFLGYAPGSFPAAEFAGTHGFHVGCHQDIGPEHIEYFAETLRTFIKERT